jgi:hypothetical protein
MTSSLGSIQPNGTDGFPNAMIHEFYGMKARCSTSALATLWIPVIDDEQFARQQTKCDAMYGSAVYDK